MTDLQIDLTATTAASRSGETAPASGRRDWQRVSLFLGGIMFAVGNMLHPLEHKDAAYESATWEAAHLTIFFSLPLLVLGLPYLQRRLAAHTDSRLAAFAVAASMAGLIGIGPGTIIETFVAPMIGHHAMTELESGGMGLVNAILGVAYLGGTIALGWVVRRCKLRPRGAGTSLIVERGRVARNDDRDGPRRRRGRHRVDDDLRHRPVGARRPKTRRPETRR